MFRFYSEAMTSTSSPCKHIFFGVCHDTRFSPVLRPLQGEERRFTLINAGAPKREFDQPSLGLSDFMGTFRGTTFGPAPTQSSSRPSVTTNHSTEERSQQQSLPHRRGNSNPADTWSVPSFRSGAATLAQPLDVATSVHAISIA